MQYLVWLQIDAAEQEICGFHFIPLSACQYLGIFISVSAKLVHHPDSNHDLGDKMHEMGIVVKFTLFFNF